MIGVALEGGGALGAFHIGAMKALYEDGCRFDGYVGTSIGAINAAVLAQGDFERMERLWCDIATDQLFDDPIARLLELGEHPLFGRFGLNVPNLLADLLHGVDTSRMKALIGGLLDERKLRAAGVDYGLVTVRLSGLRACEMRLADVPEGRLLDWVMASASFPGFKPEVIDGETYIDGGLRNNCPINLLTDIGYSRVFAIRTYGPGRFLLPATDAEVTVIAPSRRLGDVMRFESEQSRRNIALGHLDARRAMGHTIGRSLFIRPDARLDGFGLFAAIDPACAGSAEGDPRRLLFERTLPDLARDLKLGADSTYDDLALALLESAALDAGMDALKEYELRDLARGVAAADRPAQPGGARPAAAPEIARLIAQRIAG